MKTIRPAELEALLEDSRPVEIVDVRPRLAFEKCHIDGAHCLPAIEISPETFLCSRELLSTEPIYMISHSGALAQRTACELERDGFDNIVVLAGGMAAWRNERRPIVGKENGLSV